MDDLYVNVADVPPLLAGARIFIAPHHGGRRGEPSDLRAWLRALGATFVRRFDAETKIRPTHVLVQNEARGYRPWFNRARAVETARALYGEGATIIHEPALEIAAATVAVCDSEAFLHLGIRAARTHLQRQRLQHAYARLAVAQGDFWGV